MPNIILWLILRTVTSLFAAVVSPLRPLTEIEKSIPLWPLSETAGLWLERVLLAPWLRWDAVWYQRIVTQGYHQGDGTTQFFPLYPLSASILTQFNIHPTLSLLVTSSITSLILIFCFELLARLDLERSEARFSVFLVFIYPTSFILFAPYPEALFLLGTVLCFYWSRKRSWWLAGLAGGLATLTRQQGIFLILPVAWELWDASGRNPQQIARSFRKWLALIPIPTGLFLWLSYRAFILNDMQPDFSSVHSAIYTFISPSAEKVVPVQTFTWPWRALGLALGKVKESPDLDLWVNLVLGGLFLIALPLAWQRMITSYRIYTIFIILISFSYHTGPIHPYMGLPRHLLLAFPVFIGLVPLVKKSWQRHLIIITSLIGYFFLVGLYVMEAWVP